MAPKKAKGEKMAIGEFLKDEKHGKINWADEMEDAPMPSAPSGHYGGDRGYSTGGGYGSSGVNDRGYSFREQLPLPTKPPYTVHLGNMSFDATQGDIMDFFGGCEVTSVRIVEDKMEMKPKGFGYAEFASLEGLKKALDFNGTQFQGRNIRVSVAEPQKERPDGRDFGNWDRKGPLADASGPPRRVSDRGGFGSGRGGGGFDTSSDADSERGNRRGYEPSDGKIRDFGNWDRKGPLTPTLPTGNPARSFDRPVSRDGPRPERVDRRNSPSWGEGKSDAGSRPPRREFVERPIVERAPTAAEQDSQWRSKMKPDIPAAPTVVPVEAARSPALSHRELSSPPSPAAPPSAPASRPKLNLAKRTVSEAHTDASPAPAQDSKASPFGAARPIDTATREKEVEEKRQIAIRERKEAEDKARAEKKAADEKAKEEKRAARDADLAARKQEPAAPNQANGHKANGQANQKLTENGAAAPPPTMNYEILRRAANEDGTTAGENADQAEVPQVNGIIAGDTETKSKEINQAVSKPAENGDQVNGTASTDPSAEALEEEGWSTVSKPEKKRKNGNQTGRTLAS